MLIYILDDEILSAEFLKETIEKVILKQQYFTDFNIVTFNSFESFVHSFLANKPDIIFLDIEMPDKNGLEVAEFINKTKEKLGYKSNYPVVIFSTAHDEFGFDAYKLKVFDYILKPSSFNSIDETFKKIINFFDIETSTEDVININHAGLMLKIPIEDISYFQAEMKYITVFTNERQYLLNDTLNNLEIKHRGLLRIHRSYLINLSYLKKIVSRDSHWYALLKDNTSIPISRRYKAILDQTLDYRNYS